MLQGFQAAGGTLDAGVAELAAGRINFLRTGIAYADLIITVSPTYAREIQSAQYGMGLEALLRTRSADVVGILNGVDYDEWDPRHDPYLPRHFDTGSLTVKASLKAQLLQRLGLEDTAGSALIGIVMTAPPAPRSTLAESLGGVESLVAHPVSAAKASRHRPSSLKSQSPIS